MGRRLRTDGMTPAHVARTFALVRRAAQLSLGKRHFDVQLVGGWVMLQGMVAEMQTGEGKTLTATLAAATAALAGRPVHVITVNDYLVARDAELMRPVYASLGLSVAAVTAEMEHHQRQVAYGADIVYCSNKTVVFDYLRDRIVLGPTASDLQLKVERLAGSQARTRRLLLRGLHYAIVDEADSVLVDEARTPLIISASAGAEGDEATARTAYALAGQVVEGDDYRIYKGDRRAVLTEAGRQRLIDLCQGKGGLWAVPIRREEVVLRALTAIHLFHRDEHYLVRDGKIQVVDEFTGRVMPDRSWGQGLHQLIEVKEGCAVTEVRKDTLARISYQRFFQRYLHLSGMTGTAQEVKAELGAVYNLPVVTIPTNRPSRRVRHADQVFPGDARKWAYLAERVEVLHGQGVPVLIGTRSVASSEIASAALAARSLPHTLLSAKQDQAEAEVVEHAGEAGAVTIATNMAGRGTDIALGEGVAEKGGLHVILTERHEAGRIDRQLAGRGARQGDPGSFEAVLSMEDALLLPVKGGAGRSATSRAWMAEGDALRGIRWDGLDTLCTVAHRAHPGGGAPAFVEVGPAIGQDTVFFRAARVSQFEEPACARSRVLRLHWRPNFCAGIRSPSRPRGAPTHAAPACRIARAALATGNKGKKLGDDLECLVEPHMVANVGSPVEGVIAQMFVARGADVRNQRPASRRASNSPGVEAANLSTSKARAARSTASARSSATKSSVQEDLISASDKDELETQMRIAALEVKQQQEVLNQRTIVSPLNGVVVERYLAPGDHVSQEKIVKIAQIDPLNIEVIVPLELFGSIKLGDTGEVHLEPLIRGPFKAKVAIVDRVVDAASGTFGVRLELPNPGNRIPAGIRCLVRFGK